MKRLLLFGTLLLLIAARGYGQGKTITGTVTDKASAPLEAVTVSVVETQKSTLTNLKGQFTLAAEVGQTLKFSYIGAKPFTYKITSLTSPINTHLEVVGTTLNEVVVTG